MSPQCVAAIFDLDGTLVDSLADIAGAMNRVLAERGLRVHPVEAYRHFVGAGMPTLVARVLAASGGEEAFHAELLAAMRSEYARRQLDETRPYPGIVEVLGILRERGVLLAVLSNKPERMTAAVVHHFFGDSLFAVVRGHGDRLPPKPDPAGAHAVLAALAVSPTRAALVGDSDLDMQTAVAAGVRAIGVSWGFRDEAELRAHGADAIAHTPRELAQLILRLQDERPTPG